MLELSYNLGLGDSNTNLPPLPLTIIEPDICTWLTPLLNVKLLDPLNALAELN